MAIGKYNDIATKFKQLPVWMQAIIVILILYFAWRAYNFARGFLKGAGVKAETFGQITALEEQGMKATYSDSQYSDYADTLEYSMAGAGTYEDTAYSVFQDQQNDIDIIKLNMAFGARDGATLKEWLHGDFSEGEMQNINQILQAKGIAYRF